ncbi:MAG: ferritin [Desulfurococcaceae archaeon]
MNNELLNALNKQLNQELVNAYLYFSMAAFFDSQSLSGFSHYFKIQAKEELGHALKIYSYIIDRGGRVELFDVYIPKRTWNNVLEAIKDFYEAERENTKRIWNLLDLAKAHGDKATEVFLNWFVNEQVEEEKQAMDLLSKVELIKDNVIGLITLDRILAERK